MGCKLSLVRFNLCNLVFVDGLQVAYLPVGLVSLLPKLFCNPSRGLESACSPQSVGACCVPLIGHSFQVCSLLLRLTSQTLQRRIGGVSGFIGSVAVFNSSVACLLNGSPLCDE